jgi:hypothetical protein
MDALGPPTLRLFIRDESLAIARLAADAEWPSWALACRFVSLARTEDELSIVCPTAVVPDVVEAAKGWRAMQVVGPLDLSLTGVLAGLTTILADRGIAVFAISTYETDLILVREASLGPATEALIAAGYEVRAAK